MSDRSPRRRDQRQHRPNLEQVEARQLLATFTVTNVGDTGAGSLRQAILDANAAPGQDAINFAIPGTGPFSIAPASALPAISDPLTLDATTQPGFNGTPVVELNGSQANTVGPANGLTINAPSTTVRGLAINRFGNYGISAVNVNGGTIAGNYIGTDTTGALSLGNRSGIFLNAATNITVGGLTAADRNLVSGNAGDGIYLLTQTGQFTGNAVLGNSIGTDATGTRSLPNGGNGILVGSSGNQVGGVGTGQANIIAFNGLAGVQVGFKDVVAGRTSNTIRGNAIFGNSNLGIDLGSQGVTTPGGFGTGFGPNLLQPFPAINAAFPAAGGLAVEGSLTSAANSTFTVDFYANDVADPSGYGEGQRYLGSTLVTTDGTGVGNFAATLAGATTPGQFITATATDRAGNTSEFSFARSITPTAQADLSVSLFATPSPAGVDGNLTYNITVDNSGPARATNVILTDALPAGVTFVSATPSQGTFTLDGTTLNASLGEILSGASATVQVVVRPTQEGSVTNTVSVRADQGDPDTQDRTASVTTTVNPRTPADLSIFSFANNFSLVVGDQQVYTIVVGNNGPNRTASGVTVVDTLPTNATFVSATVSQGDFTVADGVLTANLGDVPLGANVVVQITVRANAPGFLNNSATVSGAQSDNNALNNTTVQRQLVTVAAADLTVTAGTLPTPARVGRPLTYTFNVGNNGPAVATGVTLIDELDPNLTVVSATSSQGTVSVTGSTLTAALGVIVAGQPAQVTVTVIPNAIGVIENTVRVRSDQTDFNPLDNVAAPSTFAVDEVVPPTILAQRLIVTRNAITAAVLTFSEPMNAEQVEALNNYQVRPSNAQGRATGAPVAIASATYDARRRTVTLRFAKPLPLGRFFVLTANGEGASGLTDTSGNVLDGDLNGLPDGIFAATIGRGTISRPRPFQRDQQVPIPAKNTAKPAKAAPAETPRVVKDVALNLAFTRRFERIG